MYLSKKEYGLLVSELLILFTSWKLSPTIFILLEPSNVFITKNNKKRSSTKYKRVCGKANCYKVGGEDE